jgi:FlaA1/EpsC-like NDP-sugar epimerase
MEDCDFIIHAAALKHVTIAEYNPMEVIKTNINGANNIVQAAISNNVKKIISLSTDKAVNPINLYGATKLASDKLFIAANNIVGKKKCIFSTVRYGNVVGSRGSIMEIFKKLSDSNSNTFPITDKSMTRFVMSIEEAAHLLIDSSIKAKGGEVFITKMPVVRIKDLAKAMIEILGPKYGFEANKIDLIEIGEKPGEKLYEELMSNEETRRALELKDYFSVLPAFRGIYNNINYDYSDIVNLKVNRAYISEKETPLSVQEIKEFLIRNKLLEKPEKSMSQRYWPGDKEQKI